MASIKVGYYPSGAENINNIPTQNFTHIIYAFLNPEDGTFEFNIDEDQAAQLRNFTAILHAMSPPVKALFSVGGGTDTAAPLLSRMASERTSRTQFIKSSISVAREFGFDGVDLYWTYPQNPTEMENLGTLLVEWRQAVKDDANSISQPELLLTADDANSTSQPELLLTAAVYYTTTISGPPCMIRSYPVSKMSANLDFINVMTYDYHGSWEPNITGAFAVLYDPKSSGSTGAGINSWKNAGAPLKKLVMGLPLYGRTWKLVDPTRADGIGAPANGVGPGTDGVMTYAQVRQFNGDNATVVHDHSVYLVAGNNWISYDDPSSVSAKVMYAKGRGLGGYFFFFWQVAGDYQWTLSKAASESWPS